MTPTRLLVFSSLVAAAGLAGCSRHQASTEQPPVPVKVHTVESGAGVPRIGPVFTRTAASRASSRAARISFADSHRAVAGFS